MAGMSESEFARRIKHSPGYVNKLKEEGRLVFTKDGRVNAPASEKLIAQTGGGRPDVAERHAAAKTATKAAEAKKTDKAGQGMPEAKKTQPAPQDEAPGEKLVDAKTRKESAQADQEEMKAKQMAGNLIAREDVDAAMRFIGGAVRAAFDVFPDQTAPLVAPITDMAEIHETISQACHDALHSIGDAIKRQVEQLARVPE